MPSALLGKRYKHLELSISGLLDRLTNWEEREVHFRLDQEERLVTNLVVTKSVVVGLVILVNPIHGLVNTQMAWASFLKVKRRLMKTSTREIPEGREDEWMETSSTLLTLLSTFRIVRNSVSFDQNPLEL